MMLSPEGLPVVVEEVDMPVDWVHKHVKTVLWMLVVTGVKPILVPLDRINSEHLSETPDLLGVWIFGNTDQVFVKKFYAFKVFRNVVLKLVHSSTDGDMLEKLKDKFLLVFVFVELFISFDVLILHSLFPEQSFSKLVSKVDALKCFFVILFDITTFAANSDFVEDIEK